MGQGLLLTTLASGFGIALVHTLIPVHWLPYALTGRARGWSLARTLTINAAGGVGHVLVTAMLGALAMLLGLRLGNWLSGVFPWVVAALLLLVGLYFVYRQLAGGAHVHGNPSERGILEARSDRAATTILVTMLLFSPCEAFVPVYLTGVSAGWAGFGLLTAVLAVATISCMLVLTTLAWHGMSSLRVAGIERWQSGLVGVLLIVLAAVMAVWRP